MAKRLPAVPMEMPRLKEQSTQCNILRRSRDLFIDGKVREIGSYLRCAYLSRVAFLVKQDKITDVV